MNNVIALILGGGRGARLFPLTLQRSKPAVGVAGKYRLIDITLSNSINSGINRVFVLTQFMSTSLHRHIMQTYRFDSFSDGFVEILAAEQTHQGDTWYQGTADAVRGSLRHLLNYKSDAVLILSGDHLYRMNYAELVDQHKERGADITIGVQPVPKADGSRLGLMKVNSKQEVIEFVEKPQDPTIIENFIAPEDLLTKCGVKGKGPQVLGSMGIYVFKPDVLAAVLEDPSRMDFGGEIIPAAIGKYSVHAFPFCGHWEDIGTIKSFFDAHLALVKPNPGFPMYEPGWPIYTRARNLPPARVMESDIHNSLLSEGSIVTGASIRDSVIGVRSVIRPGARLNNVVMLGADYYEGEEPLYHLTDTKHDGIHIGIGEGSVLERVIIDKDARIGRNVVIRSQEGKPDSEGNGIWVRDGITVIPKGTTIADGTVI